MTDPPKLRLHWLRAFVAFGDSCNLTRAAAHLGISQPAVHAHITGLQGVIGQTLYVRRGRGLVLTEAGEQLLIEARDIVQAVDRMQATVGGPAADTPPLVLAAGEGAFLYLLGPRLERFRQLHPSIPLRLLPLSGAEAAQAVAEGRADLAVSAAPAPTMAELRVRTIARVGMALAMSSSSALAGDGGAWVDSDQGLLPQALCNHSWVAPPRGAPLRAALEVAFDKAGLSFGPVAAEVTGWPLTLEFVRLGLGIAVVNAFCQPPEGVVLRPFPALAAVRYRLLWRQREVGAHPAEKDLRAILGEPTTAP